MCTGKKKKKQNKGRKKFPFKDRLETIKFEGSTVRMGGASLGCAVRPRF